MTQYLETLFYLNLITFCLITVIGLCALIIVLIIIQDFAQNDFNIGSKVVLKGTQNPIMVINSMRSGKYECIWFEEVKLSYNKSNIDNSLEESSAKSELKQVIKRAFIDPRALDLA